MSAPVLDPGALDSCAQEPIHIPGGIQPHGALLVLDPNSLEPLQASANLDAIAGAGAEALSGLDGWPQLLREIRAWLENDEPLLLRGFSLAGRALQVSGHRTAQGVILELEPPVPEGGDQSFERLYVGLRPFVDRIAVARDLGAVLGAAAAEMRRLTGFDRVLVYQFDPDWNGAVVAEDGNGVLPSYLDLHFPASDIPAQARELYRLNRLRLIPTADYVPVPVEPALSPVDGRPLDLGFAALRTVSPVHLQYMRNMGTGSSMSVSLVVDDRLWGLVSCHSKAPRRISPQLRAICDLMGQVLSLQIGERQRMLEAAERIERKQAETRLLAALAASSRFQTGLRDHPQEWLELASAQGAAVITEGELISAGFTPGEPEIRKLVEWLALSRADAFATDSLASHYPAAEAYSEVASGLLAVSISQVHDSYILWFRPEVVRTVSWGGDPRKAEARPGEQLHPRKSFDLWKEQVRQRSRPWSRAAVDTARDFRNAVINFVLRRAEEKAELTGELERSNRELESFSYSVSHDLRAPFRHIVGYAELLREKETALDDKSRHYLTSIVEAALSAGRLVDDLLSFSQLGRTSLSISRVDMDKLMAEVRRSVEPDCEGRNVEWRIGSLPPAWADASVLRPALCNLIDNALKYSAGRDPAVITIEGEEREAETVYRVADNGVGFDMAYVGKIFGVFQRLHRVEDFEGTGIGLALTKRVIDRHRGWIEAEGEVGRGAAFTFALPKKNKETIVV